LFIRLTVFNATERRNYERELINARAEAEIVSKQLHALNATLEHRISEAVQQRLSTSVELKAAHAESELREQFIAVLGHDLRNPIAAIGAGANLLERQLLDDASANVVSLIKGSVLRASALIDNVLDFARGRLGSGISLNRTTDQSLEATLEQVVNELRAVNPAREIITDYELFRPVSLDHARIAQMVSNLLANALAYGDAGVPVRLTARTLWNAFELWVANAGPKIPDKAMERLFQPFFRGEVRESQQGLGLGLHISREIARAHGGKLIVDSSADETRFTFTMPLQNAAETQKDPRK
jgi:sigma-B regulation protein RsbU (phosphoserine phosphatase)